MENKNGLVLDGLQMSTLAKITEQRIKKITMDELRGVFNSINGEEIKMIQMAIQSGNPERIQASIEIPVYRVIQHKVEEALREGV